MSSSFWGPTDIATSEFASNVSNTYPFAAFILEWCLSAPGMRADENLPYLFALEEELSKQPVPAPAASWYVDDAVWAAMKSSAKASLDESMTPDHMGRQRLPMPWALKVLRHYHVLATAQAIQDNDVPAPTEKDPAA